MVILDKNQAEIEVKKYKANDRIKIMRPDEAWTKYQYEVNVESQKEDAEKILNDAVNFVSRLKEMEKTTSKDVVLAKMNKKSL